MTRDFFFNNAKIVTISLGSAALLSALASIPNSSISWGLLAVLIFSVTVAPRLSLPLPRSKFAISFADAVIFLTFILYGGQAAVILTAAETFAACVYLRSTGFKFGRMMIPTNVSVNVLSTALTCVIWLFVQNITNDGLRFSSTQNLITILGILGLSQFLFSSVIAAVLQSIKEGSRLFPTWRRDCFSSSMTQIIGAGLAGFVYKLIGYGDLATAILALVILTIVFLTYRQTINEINSAISQVERAERAIAETERERRREAERHASQLGDSLQQQE